MKKNSFLYGTLILIIVNFIVRFLGFAYKLILSRMIGAEGIGLFHLVFPILMILITFTTAGIPVAVSKLVAYHLSLNNKRGCNKILGLSLCLGLLISTILSLFLLYNAKYISHNIIKNKDTYNSLIALIPCIPLITLSSIFRGYYYGIKDVGPPGMSQVLEQIFRIVFVIGSLYIVSPIDTSFAAMIAVIGISVGELTGFLWLIFKFKIREALRLRRNYRILKNASKAILGKIILISIPITITRLIAVIMQSINAVLIPQRLQIAGYTAHEAISIFGKLAGMAMPLLFLPFIVTSALVVNIIPTVSQEMALKNWKDIRLKSNLAIRITLLVAIPTTALFIFFSKPICSFIYNQPDVDRYLSLLALSTTFLCLHHTVSGILHGMGKQVITAVHHLIGMTIQILCTYFLVAKPSFGEKGYILGFIVSIFIICILNVRSLNHYIKLNIQFVDNILKPIIATIVMLLFVINIYKLCMHFNLSSIISIFCSISIGSLSYMFIIILSGSISFKTLKYIFTK
ncbi:stage V sporulation protein B [Crassaminicella thermophila]|uniref:Stage V sporulation protein B n=1 Tax=Crassaminicella thermophila TaxID=2599308 RepID=A0A5C0SDJ1_CRATE|nr:stage V sporulation protein B [Crassaminicella thermophila]QEK11907.1 stage V sporulation protein B [Crassaminicella thermophila]